MAASRIEKVPKGVRLFLCGDVMTGRGIDQVLPHPSEPTIYEPYVSSALAYVELAESAHGRIARPVDFAYVWGEAIPELETRAPQARIVNLETAVTTSSRATPKGINYRMNPANIGCLVAAKVDCCVLANNHVLDWGVPGLLETIESVTSAGISVAGAGRDEDDAARPAVLSVDGGRVLLFGIGSPTSGIPRSWKATRDGPGLCVVDDLSDASAEAIAREFRARREPGDILVVSIHWGGNWGYEVPENQRAFAHRLIDGGGADVVHGHSSHHAKGIEVYGGKLILYGCGDFINDYEGIAGYEEYRADLALAYFPTVNQGSGALEGLEIVPFRSRRFRLERAGDEDAGWLRDMFNREGRDLGTGVELREDGVLSLVW